VTPKQRRGAVPAIHVFISARKTWMPGTADKFTQSAQLDCMPGMTVLAADPCRWRAQQQPLSTQSDNVVAYK
jgi:O-succinylbenzoate synthase